VLNSELVEKFKSIDLRLDIANRPFSFVEDPVFSMTIRRTPRGTVRQEWFEIFIPEVAKVDVVDTHLAKQQLVLSVKEDANTFEMDPIAFSPVNRRHMSKEDREIFFDDFLKRMQRHTNEIERKDIVQNKDNRWVIMRHTPERKRHFLMGRDERQLFICQLPKLVKNVPEAFDSLKHPTVLFFEGRNKNVVRQGEWFFLNATGLELEKINRLLEAKKIDIKKGQNIGAIAQDRLFVAGNPHVADEIVCIPAKMLLRGWSAREQELFVRGCVRHHDHKTIVCGNWKKVLRNTEVQDTESAISGWID
jgi:hypothetical protein